MMLAAVMVHGRPLGEAVGTSSRYAKVRASENAIEALEMLLPTDFRRKFACDCQSTETNAENEAKAKEEKLLDLQADQKGGRNRVP
jgi:endoribonuclease Dicer